MFVQYSFIAKQPDTARADRVPFDPSPAAVMSMGVAFMAITSVLYVLMN